MSALVVSELVVSEYRVATGALFSGKEFPVAIE